MSTNTFHYTVRGTHEGVSANLEPKFLAEEGESERLSWKIYPIHEYSSPNRVNKHVRIIEPDSYSPTSVLNFNITAPTSPPAFEDFERSFAQLAHGADPFPTHSPPSRQARSVPNTNYPATIVLPRPASPSTKQSSTMEVLAQISESTVGDSVSIYSEGLDNLSIPTAEREHVTPIPFQRQRRGLEPSGRVNRSVYYISDASESERESCDGSFQALANIDEESIASSVVLNKFDTSMAALTLQVDDYSDATYMRILEDLKGNPQIRTLDVYRRDDEDSQRSRTYEDVFLLFNLLSGIPALKVLQLHNFEADELAYVADLMEESPALSAIKIRVYELHL